MNEMKNNWSKQISLPFGPWKTLEEEREKFVIKISQIKLFDFAKLEKCFQFLFLLVQSPNESEKPIKFYFDKIITIYDYEKWDNLQVYFI